MIIQTTDHRGKVLERQGMIGRGKGFEGKRAFDENEGFLIPVK